MGICSSKHKKEKNGTPKLPPRQNHQPELPPEYTNNAPEPLSQYIAHAVMDGNVSALVRTQLALIKRSVNLLEQMPNMSSPEVYAKQAEYNNIKNMIRDIQVYIDSSENNYNIIAPLNPEDWDAETQQLMDKANGCW